MFTAVPQSLWCLMAVVDDTQGKCSSNELAAIDAATRLKRPEQPSRSGKPRQRTLRFRLACLVLACVLPVCVIAGLVVYYSYQYKRDLLEKRVLETTRALSMVVDRELALMQASATAIATSPSLVSGDLAAFHRQAQAVLHDYPGAVFTLADARGQQLVNSLVPFGTPLPKHVAWEQAQRVFETGKPVILNLYKGAIKGRLVVGIGVPVTRVGRIVYVLTLTTPANRFNEVFSRHSVPPEWIVTIQDANRVLIARSRSPERYVGVSSQPAAMKLMGEAEEGSYEYRSQEGINSVSIFRVSPTSGWRVVITIPKTMILADVWQWLRWVIGGIVLLSMMGIALALFLAQRIAGSIQALITPALALGTGEPVEIRQLDLAEANEVGQSLVKASQLLQQRTAERERAEQRTAHVAAFPELNPNPIFETDLDGKITYANPAAQKIFPEILTRGASYSLFAQWPSVIAGFTTASEKTMVQEVETGGSTYEQTIYYQQELKRLRCYFDDITERKRAESVLQVTLQRFYSILSNMYSGILLVTAKGRIEYANQAFCERLDLEDAPADLVGLDAGTLIAKIRKAYRHPDEAVTRIREIVDREKPVMSEEITLRNGRTCLRDYVPLNVDGKSSGRLWVYTDITERKQAEEALLRSEKLASVGRMAATIAHEINNPLEAVTNLLFITKNAKDMASVRQYLGLADAELERIAHITRQSLGFYRESNAPALTSVNVVLESAVDLLKNKIKAKNAVIEKQSDDDVQVTAVAGELRQVFTNLLTNSLDAIDEKGTIKLRVSASTAFKNGDRCVRVTVADNGKGISADSRQHIFEPFFTTKGTVGTGLGLWVSKQIVDKHGGTIRMRSSSNGARRGTVFSIVLPVEPVTAARSQSAGA